MTTEVGVLAFDQAHDVWVFASLTAAAGGLELIDLEDGEYVGLFTHDGRLVDWTARDGTVELVVTEARDWERLVDLLVTRRPAAPPIETAEDVRAFINVELRWEWEHRLPTRPRRLHDRLWGAAPPQL